MPTLVIVLAFPLWLTVGYGLAFVLSGRNRRLLLGPAGFVLYRVLTRTEGDRKAFESQKAELAESIRSREAERLTRAYLQQERAARKVEVNEALLSSFARGSEGGGRRS